MLDLESWASGSIFTGNKILLLAFLFSRSKASDANNGIIAILVHFEKTLMQQISFGNLVMTGLADVDGLHFFIQVCLYLTNLLIPTKSFKSKDVVVHEQLFKDLLSSTCEYIDLLTIRLNWIVLKLDVASSYHLPY